MSEQTENQQPQFPFLTYDQLSPAQKNEVQIQIKKLAIAEGLDVKEAIEQSQVKDMYFCQIAERLHFADFHPISMLDI